MRFVSALVEWSVQKCWRRHKWGKDRISPKSAARGRWIWNAAWASSSSADTSWKRLPFLSWCPRSRLQRPELTPRRSIAKWCGNASHLSPAALLSPSIDRRGLHSSMRSDWRKRGTSWSRWWSRRLGWWCLSHPMSIVSPQTAARGKYPSRLPTLFLFV